MEQLSIGFIGFGLIGGSIAKAIKESFTNTDIRVYNHRHDSSYYKEALEDKTVDRLVSSFETGFSDCDLIFLCAPVLENITYLNKLKNYIKETCIITDVGSVKGNIHEAVLALGMQNQFIGGHPMAGSEKTGYHHSSALLLENAYYLLTPTEETNPSDIDFMSDLVHTIGAIPIIVDYHSHDEITAAISHVPHIIASSLVTMVMEQDDEKEHMKNFAAGGFRDITRIASSSPEMWQNICLTNTKSILKFLNLYIETLRSFGKLIEEKEEEQILQFFDHAKEYRNSIPGKSVGMISKSYEVFIDVADETGAIAAVAAILATYNISMKNIGIIHNREFSEGVLRLELYDETAKIGTKKLLRQRGYQVYDR